MGNSLFPYLQIDWRGNGLNCKWCIKSFALKQFGLNIKVFLHPRERTFLWSISWRKRTFGLISTFTLNIQPSNKSETKQKLHFARVSFHTLHLALNLFYSTIENNCFEYFHDSAEKILIITSLWFLCVN